MKTRVLQIVRWALAGALALVLIPPVAARAETVTVPLSDPGRPALVKAELVNGGIRVESWDGKEIVVEATGRDAEQDADREEEVDRDEDAVVQGVAGATSHRDDEERREREKVDKSKGLRRIPSSGLGLSVEEAQNVVRIQSESWRHSVDLRIKVPAKASLKLECVNDGDIEVSGVEGDLELSNTNGSIVVRGAGGTVVANTVNGEVTATFARLPSFKSMAFSSLNGDIDVTLPASLAADLRMSSENGEIYSDFEITLAAKPARIEPERSGGRFKVTIGKDVHGTIGGGGAEMLFKTFNGDIYIRKAK